jgi:hypothetical protein
MDFTLLIIIILLSLAFDYINGFHDAANSIATIVATKVLTPYQAVFWAAFFNFLAYWVFGFGVADTVAKTAHTSSIDLTVILAGVIAAIMWNLFTWWKGIPSSSSHTLIGGFAGAAIAHGFSGAVQDPEHYGLKIVSWLKAAKEGELLPSGVLIVILFIVIGLFSKINVMAIIFKLIFAFIWTFVLNWLCSKGYTTLSWIIYACQGMTARSPGGVVYEPPDKLPFAMGLDYVAISRCENMSDLMLTCQLRPEGFTSHLKIRRVI